MARPRKEVSTETYSGRFAVRLRTLREKAGMTVEELAEVSGVPAPTIYGWEKASSTPINESLPQIADALGVTIRVLLPKE